MTTATPSKIAQHLDAAAQQLAPTPRAEFIVRARRTLRPSFLIDAAGD